MNASANVTSLQALVAFRGELRRYEQAMRQILEEQGVEVQRASDYVELDRTEYWPRERKRAEDLVAAARSALERCKLAALQNERKSCYEEKQDLEAALARQHHCEYQVRQLRHWRNLMRHQHEEYRTKTARLTHYLDTDLPQALATLDRIIAALEKYGQVATQGPSERQTSALPADTSDSVESEE